MLKFRISTVLVDITLIAGGLSVPTIILFIAGLFGGLFFALLLPVVAQLPSEQFNTKATFINFTFCAFVFLLTFAALLFARCAILQQGLGF